MHRFDVGLWRFAIAGVWVFTCLAAAVAALGMPTGLGAIFDMLGGIVLNTVALGIASAIVMIVLAVSGLRIPRFFTGSILYSIVLTAVLFYFSEFNLPASIVLAVLITGAAALLPVAGAWLAGWVKETSTASKLAAAAGLIVVCTVFFTSILSDQNDAGISAAVSAVNPLSVDPSIPGDHAFSYFTYGSGQDRHRPEYGKEVRQLSTSVDASAYIKDWRWLRTMFWGFDQKKLPLNGRVWLPEGPGPYPLVLMLHGNHLMEQFSDEGYGYLGELLAGRGIAAISIDENFLNYSVWSDLPEADMKVRTWLLLKHIEQIQTFSRDQSSPFHGRIDFGRIALLGHSRGAQAAAMAADRDKWFKEDSALPRADSYSVQGVVALAPTDTLVDGKQAELKDISFLTIHGAKDSDLVDFHGDRLYGRTLFPHNANGFKTSLYIADANHSQFNTEWQSDAALPTRLFITPAGQLKAEEQRHIAEVYVSAFLETVLKGSSEFHNLFRDYRTALQLLPASRYYNRYQNGSFQRIADYEADDRAKLSSSTMAQAVNMSQWRHVQAVNRQREAKGNKGVILEWKQSASYEVSVISGDFDPTDDSVVSFAMADYGHDLSARSTLADISIEVEAEDAAGVAVRLPLAQFMDIQPLPVTDYTWLPGKESILLKDRYKEPSEPVFQTYELPLHKFHDANARFDPSNWTKLTLYFDGGPGKAMLDDIGLSR
ncbi:alpha/beta hydrolase [Cohnella kolymensis]|nr:alpha/beta hydrolase [Cohnella kolymensis]